MPHLYGGGIFYARPAPNLRKNKKKERLINKPFLYLRFIYFAIYFFAMSNPKTSDPRSLLCLVRQE